MTNKELQEKLSLLPDDMPVMTYLPIENCDDWDLTEIKTIYIEPFSEEYIILL